MSCSFQFYLSTVFHLLSFPRRASTGKYIPVWSFPQPHTRLSALCSLNSKTKDTLNANNFGYLLDWTSDSPLSPQSPLATIYSVRWCLQLSFIFCFKDYLEMQGVTT